MTIQWLGQACFKIQTKGKQGEVIIVTDPFSDSTGLKMPRFQADIITVSCDQKEHNNTDAIRGEPYIIVHPGEYETKDVFIYGVPALNEKNKTKLTLFKLFSEDIAVAHLSDLAGILNSEQIDRLGNVDILFIPIGNGLDAKKVSEIISQIEPRLVIPIISDSKNQVTIDDFLKTSGLKADKMDKLKIAKKDLISEDTRVILLSV